MKKLLAICSLNSLAYESMSTWTFWKWHACIFFKENRFQTDKFNIAVSILQIFHLNIKPGYMISYFHFVGQNCSSEKWSLQNQKVNKEIKQWLNFLSCVSKFCVIAYSLKSRHAWKRFLMEYRLFSDILVSSLSDDIWAAISMFTRTTEKLFMPLKNYPDP